MTASTTYDETEQRFEERLKARRLARVERLGREPMLWLAVVPSWTLALADACEYPFPEGGPDAFLTAAEAAQLCRVVRPTAPTTVRREELRFLGAIAEHLPGALVDRALALAEEIDDPAAQAWALDALAPHLDSERLERAVRIALNVKDDGHRAAALVALLPGVAATQRRSLVPLAASAARNAARADTRAPLLARLARVSPPVLQYGLAEQARAAVAELSTAEERAGAWAEIARILGIDEAPGALAEVASLEDDARAATLLVALAAHVDAPDDRSRVLAQARARAERVLDRPERTAVLLAITRELGRIGHFDAAEGAAGAIQDHEARAVALGRLGADLARTTSARDNTYLDTARQMLSATVRAAPTVTTLAATARELASVAPEAARDFARHAAEAARALESPAELVGPLCALAPALAETGLTAEAERAAARGTAAARRIEDVPGRIQSLLMFVPWLAPKEAGAVLDEAVQAVRSLDDLGERTGLLRRLLPHLDLTGRQALVEESAAVAARSELHIEFSMPDAARKDVLGLLREETTGTDLHERVVLIGRRIEAARKRGLLVPATVARWADLAGRIGEHGAVANAARFFDAEVTEALDAGDVAGALDWTSTADLLATTLGHELAGRVRYASRRIELVYRRRLDARDPEPVLERREQIEAFEALLADAGERWALHYLGSGGVGKTTLLRYVTRNAKAYGIAIGRVDFDYLSADYPQVRPEELLVELMVELQLYAESDRAEGLVGTFHNKVLELQESRSPPTGTSSAKPLDDPRFRSVLGTFCDYLQVLERRPVLLLDTCEELARFQPEGSRLPHVMATFELIEAARTPELSRLRLVFAGRRPLAAGGRGWDLNGVDPQALPERPYLRMHEIQGFTEREARHYLRDIRKLTVKESVINAILTRSADVSRRSRVVWRDETVREEPQVERHNPFDLAMYAEWAAAVPKLKRSDILTGTSDPYIERRILGRMSEDGRRLMPAVALVQRVDADLLRKAFEGSDAAFDDAFADLSRQSWTSWLGGDGVPAELQIEPRLHPRLRSYFEDGGREASLNSARRLLAPVLQARLAGAELGKLSPPLVNDALALLPHAVAGRAFHGLVLRAAGSARLDWIDKVAGHMLGEDGLISRCAAHPLRAAVRAAFAAVLLHDGRASEAADQWRGVLAAVSDEPDDHVGTWLRDRAIAGLVARAPDEAGAWIVEFRVLIRSFSATVEDLEADEAEQLAAGCCAALEALADAGSEDDPLDGRAVDDFATALMAAEVSEPVAVHARAVAARWYAAEGRFSEGRLLLESAEGSVPSFEARQSQRWLDWIAPASITDRVRLEVLTLDDKLHPFASEVLEEWVGEALEREGTIDAERLLSRITTIRLARGEITREALKRLAAADAFDPQRRPTCAAHQRTPPLFVAVAMGRLAVGDADKALADLDARGVAARTSGDRDTVRIAEAATIAVLRRLRLGVRARTSVLRAARSPEWPERDDALALMALTHDPAEPEPRPELWRYQSAFGPGALTLLSALGEEHWRSDEELSTVEERLDRQEWRLLTGRRGGLRIDAREMPDDAERAVRATLRAGALDRGWERLQADAPRRVGNRRAAELALEEGELLALRLPDRAHGLLELAKAWFLSAGDVHGEATARLVQAIAGAHAEWSAPARRELEASGVAVADLLDVSPSELMEVGGDMAVLERRFGAWCGWAQRASYALRWSGAETPLPPAPPATPAELRPDPPDRAPPTGIRWRAVASTVGSVCVAIAALLLVGLGLRALLHAGGWEVGLLAIPVLSSALFTLTSILVLAVNRARATVRFVAASSTPLRLAITIQSPGESSEPWPPEVPLVLGLEQQQTGLARSTTAPALMALMLDMYLALLLRRKPRAYQVEAREVVSAGWVTPPLMNYDRAAATFPEPVADVLRDLRASARHRGIRVRLELPAELGGLPWEAIVSAASQPAWLAPRERGHAFVYRRADLAADVVPATGRLESVGVLADLEWQPGALDNWRGHVPTVTSVHPRELGLPGRPDVIHAIGRPVSTSSGHLLQVLDMPTDSRRIEKAGRDQSALLGADALAGDAAGVVVIQGEPFDVEQRLSTDRDEVARLKLLASEVFAAGSWAVIVVPTLPPPLATEVIARIAQAGGDPDDRQSRAQLLGDLLGRRFGYREHWPGVRLSLAVRESRGLVREWPSRHEPGSDARELAFAELAEDLCLLVREPPSEWG